MWTISWLCVHPAIRRSLPAKAVVGGNEFNVSPPGGYRISTTPAPENGRLPSRANITVQTGD